MAKADKGVAPSQTGSLVPFGKYISIDPTQRIAKFDNGKAKAYRAIDSRDKNKNFIALISDVTLLPRTQYTSAYDTILSTSLLRLAGSGVIKWPLAQRQQFVFLYQGELGEALVSPGSFSKVYWRYPEMVQYLVLPMAKVLKEMSSKTFSHGSIRASNIFYASGDRDRSVILGDCLSVQQHSAQPSVYLPVDKTLAQPMSRGRALISDDVYAFGVSLAMFLRKQDEIGRLSDEEMVRKKIEIGSYGAILGAERMPAAFIELLRGVLHDDPKIRWKVSDIFAWLEGARVTPPSLSARLKATGPINFMGRKYFFPDTLALEFPKSPSELAQLVASGEMAKWVDKSLNNKELSGNFVSAIERVEAMGGANSNKDYLVTQMSMVFNPALPLHYKGVDFTYDGLGSAMTIAALKGKELDIYKDAILRHIPDYALSLKKLSQTETVSFVKSLDKCRVFIRQKGQGTGIERCVYLLCADAPCLSPKFINHLVYNERSTLLTFEALAKRGGQVALFLDSHCIAYFNEHNPQLMERVNYDLNGSDKDMKIAANMRFLGALQKRTNIPNLKAISSVFVGSLSGVYKVYNNLKLRQQVKTAVEAEAEKGSIFGMVAAIDNETALKKDEKAFRIARAEFRMLQKEYNDYNIRLKNKKAYGLKKGRDIAALVAWVLATGLVLMTVIAFMSGYRIF